MASEQSTADVASSSKRRKVSLDTISDPDGEPHEVTMEEGQDRAAVTQEPTSKSLSRPITPPLSKRAQSVPVEALSLQLKVKGKGKRKRGIDNVESAPSVPVEPLASQLRGKGKGKHPLDDDLQSAPRGGSNDKSKDESTSPDVAFVPSPFQLTRIKDLSASQNVDTIGLGGILGDPLIRECWNFNFLFDIDFVMQHLDPDVRDQVQMKIVHGFWKKEDGRKLALEEAASRYPNIKLIGAYMPDPFGTHHSKMLILIRHDDQAQIMIHTANMISRDWGNMTQAVWRSPLLPLLGSPGNPTQNESHPLGTGKRFKVDVLRYISAYGRRLSELKAQLQNYDFSTIRAAFIGSTPSREKPRDAKPNIWTAWGWPGVQEILSTVPISSAPPGHDATPDIVIQISSIATLGPTTTWLDNFKRILSKGKVASSTTNKPTFPSARNVKPTMEVIFPTAHEIRTSLDGYASGASIHTKLQSSAQQKQLEYLRPYLCHWKHLDPQPTALANTGASTATATNTTATIRRADRGPAAPHIKTYIRFHDQQQRRIDWAMVTSANLSKQAWGDVENKNGEVWIQSWECGVVVWPELFLSCSSSDDTVGDKRKQEQQDETVEMVPVFGKDMPCEEDGGKEGVEDTKKMERKKKILVGLRMPYDLPLEPYAEDEVPWCASMVHEEPDWMGRVWGV